MPQLKPRFLSFEDYLAYDDGTDKLYELFNGELIEVPPESGFNVEAANFLFAIFLAQVGHRRVRGHGLELEVHGEPKNRYPDLTILRPEHSELLQRRNTIRLTMPPPLLVVEVVSPGSVQRDRDYIAKRSQYEAIGIPEYWLVNPQDQTLLILELVQGQYVQNTLFAGDQTVRSPQFGVMAFTVRQCLELA
ncbi:MAG: Uma2 family endonuclease [Cyanobacteria bacterium P01_G01_bin.54]